MRTDAIPQVRNWWWSLPLGALIIAAAIVVDDPDSGVLFLLAGPIAMVALEYGPRGGLVAAISYTALMFVGAQFRTHDTDTLGYVDRIGLFVFVALLVGWMAGRLRGANVALGDTVRDEQDFSEAILQTINALVVVFDMDARIVSVNRATEAAVGYRADELVGRLLYDTLLPAEDADSVREVFATVRPEDFPTFYEVEWIAKDGSRRRIAWTSGALLDDAGGIRYVIGTGIDVTEQRKLERVASQSHARLQAYFDHAPAVLFWKDRESRFVAINKEGQRVLGRPLEAIVGRTPADFFPADVAQRFREVDVAVLEGEGPQTREYTLPGAVGQRSVRTVTFPLAGDDGAPYGVGGISVDFTDLVGAKDELEVARRETIAVLARAVEFRDEDTGEHIERMSELCERIARRLGLDDERCGFIRLASPMHDAGKIAIPDDVLLKPGRLTDDERAIIERHAEIGWSLLKGSTSRVLELAAVIAYTHHERYDGTGYPRGLAGEDIPLEGRIAATADVFDALTSDRVYRPAFTIDRAVEMMQADRGTHFDPVVLDALFEEL